MKIVALSNKKNTEGLKINPEYNYSLIGINLPYYSEGFKDYTVINPSVSLKYEIKNRKGEIIQEVLLVENVESLKNKLEDGYFAVNPKKPLVSHSRQTDYYSIEFIADYGNWEDFQIDLEIEIIPLNVKMDDPLKIFREHLEQQQNSRILFSAPFGHGKTTFLNYFFEQHDEDYEVFHLFPVNYSVAPNEDIFQYIKAEVLFQLMGKEVEFDKARFGRRYTLPFYLYNNTPNLLIDFLIPFFQLYPKTGKQISDIVKGIVKIARNYLTYHEDIQIDDKDVAEQYINRLYEKEGSIVEDNFFTQLIRQLNEQIQKNGKKTVLIIDDTDRMDPGHIFRILNVFAAHFDTDSNKEDGYSNKLGFDKLIIVTDNDNLKYIFQHLYGPKTHFEGYINKFFSKSIFKFDNKFAISHFIESEWINGKNGLNYLGLLLFDFHTASLLSLRELLMINKTVETKDLALPNPHRNKYQNFLNELWVLSQVMGFFRLIDNLLKCQEQYFDNNNRISYNQLSSYAIAALLYEPHNDNELFVHSFKDFELKFRIDDGGYNAKIEDKTLQVTPDYPNFKFNKSDFYMLLADLAKKYKSESGASL